MARRRRFGPGSRRCLLRTPRCGSLPWWRLNSGMGSRRAPVRKPMRGWWRRSSRAVNLLAFEPEDAKVAGQLRAGLESVGKPIGAYDLLIAGQALRHQLALVTANGREFSRVKEVGMGRLGSGLTLANLIGGVTPLVFHGKLRTASFIPFSYTAISLSSVALTSWSICLRAGSALNHASDCRIPSANVVVAQ